MGDLIRFFILLILMMVSQSWALQPSDPSSTVNKKFSMSGCYNAIKSDLQINAPKPIKLKSLNRYLEERLKYIDQMPGGRKEYIDAFYRQIAIRFGVETLHNLDSIITRINGAELDTIKAVLALSFFRSQRYKQKYQIKTAAKSDNNSTFTTSVYLDLIQSKPNKSSIEVFTEDVVPLLIKSGVKKVFIAPTFMSSPRIDGGYDPRDTFQIDPLIGNRIQFKKLIDTLNANNIGVMTDLMGHVSSEHPYFQALLKGDLTMQKYFITRDSPPIVRNRISNGSDKSIVYQDDHNPESTYERQLVFGNQGEPDHWHLYKIPVLNHETGEPTPGKFKDIWVYSTFYRHQIDLNLQNPYALGIMIEQIRYWSDFGIRDFRGDAAPWSIKLPGQSGRSQNETVALHQLYSLFARLLNENSGYVPEAVETLDGNLRLAEDSSKNFKNSKVRSGATGIYLLQFVEALRAYAITGNFSMAYQLLKEIIAKLPDNINGILSLTQHDQFYLGFLKDWGHLHEQVTNHISDHGGFVSKDGNSGVGSLNRILDQSSFEFLYKMAFGLKGEVYTQLGSEFDLPYNWDALYKNLLNRLNAEVLRGQRKESDPYLQTAKDLVNSSHKGPPPVTIDPSIREKLLEDLRYLQRWEIVTNSKKFEDAVTGRNSYFSKVVHLAEIKSSSDALKNGKTVVLETFNQQSSAWLRVSQRTKESILVLGNGSMEPQEISIHIGVEHLAADEIKRIQDSGIIELESGVTFHLTQPIHYYDNKEKFVITLRVEPKTILYLKLK